MRRRSVWTVVALTAFAGASLGRADVFTGTLYYTTFAGGTNVWDVQYSYNDATHAFSLTNNQGLAALAGADGIIFDAGGNLLVGGQGSNNVFQGTGAGGPWYSATPGDGNSYHLALSPDGKTVYTSNFRGPLDVLPIGTTPGSIQNGTAHAVTAASGNDTGVTQLAFAPNGNVYYVDGNPNGHGDLGLFNLTTDQTTELYGDVVPAHGLIYDNYSGLITMFGDGFTGTIDPNHGNALKTSSVQFACDFDQGATDGHGHALVAGCNGITLLDYSHSGDITHPDYNTTIFGFGNIDDVAPLSGLGSSTPEPGYIALIGVGLPVLFYFNRRRSQVK